MYFALDPFTFYLNVKQAWINLLREPSITPTGEMTRNPTLKNRDRGYEFMPKYGKQVSARKMIIPCMYRSYICFAKVEFN